MSLKTSRTVIKKMALDDDVLETASLDNIVENDELTGILSNYITRNEYMRFNGEIDPHFQNMSASFALSSQLSNYLPLSVYEDGDFALKTDLANYWPITANFLDKEVGGVVSADVGIEGAMSISGNISQGDSTTSNAGSAGQKCVALNDSTSLGSKSFAANQGTASADNAMAVGNAIAFAAYSAAEGVQTSAMGYASHAEGDRSQTGLADEIGSSAERQTYGAFAHAEGCKAKAVGKYSHAEGEETLAQGRSSHAEGSSTSATYGIAAHAEGKSTEVSADFAHAEGQLSKAKGECAHAEGYSTEASGEKSHAEGNAAKATNVGAHAEGLSSTASGQYAHAEGNQTSATGNYSHAEGDHNKADGSGAHAAGYLCEANADNSTAIGYKSRAVSSDSNSFVWQGHENNYTHYESHGSGTFNINPADGQLSNVYIGESNLIESTTKTIEQMNNAQITRVVNKLNISGGGSSGSDSNENLQKLLNALFQAADDADVEKNSFGWGEDGTPEVIEKDSITVGQALTFVSQFIKYLWREFPLVPEPMDESGN